MKRLILGLLFHLALVPHIGWSQGILLPENSRIAPWPRPLPGPHPLGVRSLKIETRILDQVATTRVTQEFHNDLDFVVDGIYAYPLPEDATFVEFATWDGDRKLRGEILEREEARRRYLAVVRRCWDPGLLEYAGKNLFQARVYPVPPRSGKKVELVYSQILKADHGLVSYVYPLQDGTRVNPAAIGSVVLSAQIDSKNGLKNVYSPTHTIDLRRDGERRARLSFEVSGVVPDRNFQLFYSLSDADFGLNLITYRESGDDGYFMILLSPRVEHQAEEIIPKDIIFVLDTSGSMQDRGKIEKARAALRFGVRSLHAGDRFNIVTFSSAARRFRDETVPATAQSREEAERFIDRQEASGGTNIHEALEDALGGFQPGPRPRYLVFLTDGLPTVGETDPGRILKATRAGNTVDARIFTFGVGFDVNTYLLDQLASRNGGSADYVTPDEDLEVKLSNFFSKVASPVMAQLALDLGPAGARDVYPADLPDLFRGSQQTVLGRYTGSGTFSISLQGTVRGRRRSLIFDSNHFPSSSPDHEFLPRLWAMRKVGYLLDQIRTSGENPELKSEIVSLAKRYGFVTPYTSFLAMDERDLMTGNAPAPMLHRLQMDAARPTAAAPSREAVSASISLREMKSAEVVVAAKQVGFKTVRSKTFMLDEGTWTDTAYDARAGLPVVDLPFGSESLLAAVASDPELASYAALGRNVIVVHKGKVYRIRA